MPEFIDVLPKGPALYALEVEDLAGYLIEFLHSLDRQRQNAVMRTKVIVEEFVPRPFEQRYEVQRIVIESWCWLIQHGFLIPDPNGDPNLFAFSRLGQRMKSRAELAEFRSRLRFPRELLHEVIATKAWPHYLRGEYDTAVFQAFKEVEVAVRTAGGYPNSEFGKNLMRKAFSPTTESTPGPLSDSDEPVEEQKSLQEWFAGAYGRVRNPTAHRHGVLTDAAETFEMLVTASHLLRVVDRRRPGLLGTDTSH